MGLPGSECSVQKIHPCSSECQRFGCCIDLPEFLTPIEGEPIIIVEFEPVTWNFPQEGKRKLLEDVGVTVVGEREGYGLNGPNGL